jgi:hypothetical protein
MPSTEIIILQSETDPCVVIPHEIDNVPECQTALSLMSSTA